MQVVNEMPEWWLGAQERSGIPCVPFAIDLAAGVDIPPMAFNRKIN